MHDCIIVNELVPEYAHCFRIKPFSEYAPCTRQISCRYPPETFRKIDIHINSVTGSK